jgi:MFS transporter, DHA3 family, macrolide efflux protein
LGGTFHYAAMQAATSLMVPNEQLARVSGMNQGLQGVMSILTPPLGALAMSVMPLEAIMAIDVITAAFAIGPLFFVPVPEPERRPEAENAHLVRGLAQDIAEGFVYIWNWRGMFIVLVVAALLNAVINPAFSLMPILVKNHFGGGALQLGWVESAWGFGLVIGGVTLSVWGGFERKILTSMLGLIVAGFSFAAVGIVPPTGLNMALVALFIAGISNVLINGPFFAILQAVVAPEIQGRVFTTVQSLAGLAAPIGMAISGPLSDAFGVQMWFVISGIICLTWGIGLRAFPSVMHLEEHGREAPAAAVAAPGEVELAAPGME